jgi:nucleoside-diphosphate-sugar epimerase
MRILLIGGLQETCRITAETLRAQDHEVTVFAGSAEAGAQYRELGADVVEGSVYRLSCLEGALDRQDVVVFFGTDMPETMLPNEADLRPFDRLRREGSRNLVAALVRQRVPLVILVSSVIVYGNCGEKTVDETAPLTPPALAQSFVDMEEVLNQGSEFQGLRRVILRAGLIYSAHAWHTRFLFSLLNGGRFPPLAGERSYVSPIHAADLAAAVAAAAERAPAGVTLNVTDDQPLRLRDLLLEGARAMGVKPPGALPGFLLRLSVGKEFYRVLQASCRADNARAKRILEWKPRFPSVLERLREEIATWRAAYLTKTHGTDGATASSRFVPRTETHGAS